MNLANFKHCFCGPKEFKEFICALASLSGDNLIYNGEDTVCAVVDLAAFRIRLGERIVERLMASPEKIDVLIKRLEENVHEG